MRDAFAHGNRLNGFRFCLLLPGHRAKAPVLIKTVKLNQYLPKMGIDDSTLPRLLCDPHDY
jgi:hypothetical protein